MSDIFAEIAEGFRTAEDRGLITPQPIKINSKITRLTENKVGPFDYNNIYDSEAALREIKALRERYAPFLRSLAPKYEPKEQRIDITDFTFSLNGGKKQKVKIPHYGGPCGKVRADYESDFTLPSFENKNIFLHFDGSDYITQVFVNGEFAGSHEGFFSPFEFDITPFAKKGKNKLKIVLYNDITQKDGGDKVYAATGLGWDSYKDGWHHCPPGIGIYNRVYAEIREKEHITALFPRVNSNASEVWVECNSDGYYEKDVKFLLSLYGENFEETVFENLEYTPSTVFEAGLNDTFTVAILSANGSLGNAKPLKLLNGLNRFKIPFRFDNKKLWSPDAPYLYNIKVELIVDGVVKSVKSETFGVRDFTQDLNSAPKGKFYLNGEEIKLYGANTMGFEQWDVLRGDFEQLIDDILLAKVCNMNFLRLTQRPVQREIYDYCDRLGLLIQTDLPLFGVIRIHKVTEVLRQAAEMEKLIRSHPCCILDSYINEPFPNANNQPHRNIDRAELMKFFDMADIIVKAENPDRVIKHVDGDYDPPNNLLPDSHCYSLWYNGHGIEMGKLNKGYWLPVKEGWHIACGEFGAEGLDFYSTMKNHYPKDWIEEPADLSKIIKCQTSYFYRFFFEERSSMEEWIKASQEYQAFATRLMTANFRRSGIFNSIAIHLFIDAFPSGWMKSIVDCDRNLKPAFFEYKRCLNPVYCNIRTDKFTQFADEKVSMETYICNDKNEKIDEVRYAVLRNGEVVYTASEKPTDEISQGRIEFEIPDVKGREKIEVLMGVFADGELLNFDNITIELFEREELNKPEITSYAEYKTNKKAFDEKAKNGARIIIGDLPFGECEIADSKINVRKCAMNSLYFAARDTGSNYVEGIERDDFRYFYNSETDEITPIIHSTFKGENLIPILRSTNKNEKCIWEEQLACAEIKVGKGSIVVSTIDISGKENNPVMVKFLNNIAK